LDGWCLAEGFPSLASGRLPSMPSAMPQRTAPDSAPQILSADGLPHLQA